MNQNCTEVNEQLLKHMSVKELTFLYCSQVNESILGNIKYSYSDSGYSNSGYSDSGYSNSGYSDCGSCDTED